MQVPKVELTKAGQETINKLIKASKNRKMTLSQQMQIANYYAYTCTQGSKDHIDYAKLIMSK